MNKCIEIFLTGNIDNKLLQKIKKYANSNDIEGVIQINNDDSHGNDIQYKVIACGKKDDIEKFIDNIYAESSNNTIQHIEIAAHAKGKDYRGVFRIII